MADPERFDVIVIGTGAAGATVATKCAAAGKKVAIVDSRPYGGTCALRGCDPKKVLVSVAHTVDMARRLADHGVETGAIRIDWTRLMAFKRTFTEPVPEQRERSFRKKGIETLHGRARFTGPTSLRVDDRGVQADNIVVASGAKPRPLHIDGEDKVIDSTAFLERDRLPERIVFIGGGYISFEFAHIAAVAGARPTILHRSERPLKGFDPDLVDRLTAASRGLGIDVRTDAPVVSIQGDGPFRVQVKDGEPVECDLVVHGAGRVPEIDDLDLATGNVDRDKQGVVVDRFLQSVSNPHVYAAGDAASTAGAPLTPVATAEGHTVAANILDGNQRTVEYAGTASVVFTLPPLARVGMTEDEAKEQGLDVEVHHDDATSWFSYRRTNSRVAAYKVLVEKATGKIVGAHILGGRAEETIDLFALAIREGIAASALKKVPWAYPGHGSDVPYMV